MLFLDNTFEQRKNNKETVSLFGVDIRKEKTQLEYKNKCHYSAILLDNVDLIGYITSEVKCFSYEAVRM
jgi:hypothetical protein